MAIRTSRVISTASVVCTAALLAACGGGTSSTTDSTASSTTGDATTGETTGQTETDATTAGPGTESETGPTTDPTTGPDSETETGTETDTDGEGSTFCVDNGFAVAELNEDSGIVWGAPAGHFVVNTTFGVWDLAEHWTGCDTYVFIAHLPDNNGAVYKNSLKGDLFTRSAPNVHYFFGSYGADAEAEALDWQTRVGGTLAGLSQEQIDHWKDRVHFVTDPLNEVEGGVGAFAAANGDPRNFAIDRAHTWDNPGNYQDTLGGNFSPDINVMGYLGRYYNFRYDQDQELAAQQDVTIVPMMEAVQFAPDCMVGDDCFDQQNGPFSNSNNNAVWPVAFPDAATMAQFDTMEFDLAARCGPDAYADCGHWDYEAFISLCDTEACEGKNEVIRWITPYSRPGRRRWVVDVTPFLGMVRDGGTHYFSFGMLWNMNPSTWDMHFRLRNTGQDGASVEVIPAFAGNKGFNDTYNDGWEPLNFTPPPSTKRVELVAIISGHGQEAGNCAEWCEHQHEFTLNGSTSYRREFPNQVAASACAEQVDIGVVPGQGGNWTPGRAGWCPGLPVQPWRVDITEDVNLGEENTLDYQGLYNNGTPIGGRIRLNSYVVFYE